jgi:homospermidine synthase
MSASGASFEILYPLQPAPRNINRGRLLGGSASALNSANSSLSHKYARLEKNVIFVGFGSIAQGTVPLLFRHFDVLPSQVHIITADDRGKEIALEYGLSFTVNPLTRENYKHLLTPLMVSGSFLVNLSVDVSSEDLIRLCHEHQVFYIDTCTEPWAGEYNNPNLSLSERSNYSLRLDMLNLRDELGPGTTAVITHGANPGLVSHLVKQALLNIARDTGFKLGAVPTTRAEWAKLAMDLDIKVIHVAERDTQLATVEAAKKPHEFVNTWSVDGFISEGAHQPSELGWGTHEKQLPLDGHKHKLAKAKGRDPSSIFLDHVGGETRVRTWTPNYGSFIGFVVTHAESVSISDYLTLNDADGKTVYRPTVHYAYHPCDYAVMSMHEMQGNGWVEQKEKRVLQAHEIVSGMDELGVLLMGHKKGVYWYGSQLTMDQTRKLAPYQNATALQVTAPLIGAMVWALENPNRGVVEPDEMNFSRVLEIASPYLGNVVGKYSDWNPIKGRKSGVADSTDPWQFSNFRIL